MCRGESPQERVKPMDAGPSQMPEEGAGPLPSPPLPSPAKGFGERHRQGRGLVPSLWGVVLGVKAMGNKDQTRDDVGRGTRTICQNP